MTMSTPSPLFFLHQRYQSAVQDHLETALASLRDQWQPARAMIQARIDLLQQLMQDAQDAGETIDTLWIVQQRRLEMLLKTIDEAARQYAQAAQETIGAAQQDAADLGTQAAQAALRASVPPGIVHTFGVPPQDALDGMASALQEGTPLSDLFGTFGAQAAALAQQALFAGVALGQNPREIARGIRDATDMTAQRAEVIARTEVMRTYRDAQMANFRANSDVVQAWVWAASFSERTCSACLAMDGTIHDLSETLDDHICGRCVALPVTGSWGSILGQLGMDAQDLADAGIAETSASAWLATRQSGADWFAAQDIAVQNRIMGPAKATAYRLGDIQLNNLVGVKHDAVWGDSIYERSLREIGLNAQDYLYRFKLPSGEAAAEATGATAAQLAPLSREALARQVLTADELANYQHLLASSDRLAGEVQRYGEASVRAWERGDLETMRRYDRLEASAQAQIDTLNEYERRIAEARGAALGEAMTTETLGQAPAVNEAEAIAEPAAASMDANATLQQMMADAINNPSFDVGGNFSRFADDLGQQLAPQLQHVDEILNGLYPEALEAGDSFVSEVEREYASAIARGEELSATSLDEYKAQAMVRQVIYGYHLYAGGSSSISPIQVALQEAARAEFGLNATARYTAEQLAAAQAAFGDAASDLQLVLRGMYDKTQAWFADHGISEITLYRGMRVPDPALYSGVPFDGRMVNAEIALQPISSYTADLYGVAAEYRGVSRGADYSLLVQTTVPVSDILSTPFTGFGAMYQSEVVVLGGDYPSQVIGLENTMSDEEVQALLRAQFGKEGEAANGG